METFPERLAKAISAAGLSRKELAERTGAGSSALAKWLAGQLMPKSEHLFALSKALNVSMEWLIAGGEIEESSIRTSHEPLPLKRGRRSVEESRRTIPVLGWAHAGEAESYEEIPKSWQDRVPTDCQDERAFAVRLEGDSMQPDFRAGDTLVLMPDRKAYSGLLVVAKMRSDGLIFRRMQVLDSGRIRLLAINTDYLPTEHDEDEFAWIAPVWGSWRQIWK